jgi:hypothetical protein
MKGIRKTAFCSKCGQLTVKWKFCPYCGEQLKILETPVKPKVIRTTCHDCKYYFDDQQEGGACARRCYQIPLDIIANKIECRTYLAIKGREDETPTCLNCSELIGRQIFHQERCEGRGFLSSDKRKCHQFEPRILTAK